MPPSTARASASSSKRIDAPRGALLRDCYYVGSANPPDRERPLMTVTDLDLGRYKLGWSDDVEYVFKPEKGLNTAVVDDVSWWKGEPEWMRKFRQKSLRTFER